MAVTFRLNMQTTAASEALLGKQQKTARENQPAQQQKEEKLVWNAEKEEKFAELVQEEWNATKAAANDPQSRWEALRSAIWGAARRAEMTRERKAQGKTRGWFDQECKDKRREMWQALKLHLKNSTEQSRVEYTQKRAERNELFEKKKNTWQEKRWKIIEQSSNMSEFWHGVNLFRPKGRTQPNEEITEEDWLNHFQTLLGATTRQDTNRNTYTQEKNREETTGQRIQGQQQTQQTESEEADTLNGEITATELNQAIKRMKKGKAPGEDGITMEFLHGLTPELKQELLETIQQCWKEEKIPDDWKIARIFPIYKAGDEGLAQNYRGIALLDIGYKIFAQILATRISDWIEKNNKLRESQAGFRPGRGTRDHIFTLNALIENRFRKRGGKLYTCFIDFKAAFDLVDRKGMLHKLEKTGIKGKMHRVVSAIYEETWNEVITGSGISERFRTEKGVRQGCPLSPTLFGIHLDDIDESWEKKKVGGTVIGGTKIYALKYADDIAIMAENAEELTEMIKATERYANRNNMRVNVGKTKIMIFRNGGKKKQEEKWKIYDQEIEVVNNFKYLGYWFTTANTPEFHLRKMAGRTQRAINSCWGLLKRCRINTLRKRLYLYNTLAKSTCTYGIEVWGWKRRETIERLQARYVKMAMGLNVNTPSYIWKLEAGRRSMEVEAFARANRYLMETLEMDDNRWPKKCTKELLRGIANKNACRFGRTIEAALHKVGDGTTPTNLRKSLADGNQEELRSKTYEQMGKNIKTLADQDTQADWAKVDASRYCREYKTWKKETAEEQYWEDKTTSGTLKEQWARIRCGNLGKSCWKGFSDTKCRACGAEEETLIHIFNCNAAREIMGKEVVEALEAFEARTKMRRHWTNSMPTWLQSHPIREICLFAKEFEKLEATPA